MRPKVLAQPTRVHSWPQTASAGDPSAATAAKQEPRGGSPHRPRAPQPSAGALLVAVVGRSERAGPAADRAAAEAGRLEPDERVVVPVVEAAKAEPRGGTPHRPPASAPGALARMPARAGRAGAVRVVFRPARKKPEPRTPTLGPCAQKLWGRRGGRLPVCGCVPLRTSQSTPKSPTTCSKSQALASPRGTPPNRWGCLPSWGRSAAF